MMRQLADHRGVAGSCQSAQVVVISHPPGSNRKPADYEYSCIFVTSYIVNLFKINNIFLSPRVMYAGQEAV